MNGYRPSSQRDRELLLVACRVECHGASRPDVPPGPAGDTERELRAHRDQTGDLDIAACDDQRAGRLAQTVIVIDDDRAHVHATSTCAVIGPDGVRSEAAAFKLW